MTAFFAAKEPLGEFTLGMPAGALDFLEEIFFSEQAYKKSGVVGVSRRLGRIAAFAGAFRGWCAH